MEGTVPTPKHVDTFADLATQRAKVTRVARKPALPTINCERPGDMNNIETFYTDFQTEDRVAAYCGYTHIANFRKLLLSHFFVEQYLACEGWWEGMHKASAFKSSGTATRR